MINYIREAAQKKIIESEHCANKRVFTNITKNDILEVISNGTIIEDYPNDKRGHSCLIAKIVKDRMLHVCCSPKPDHLKLITVYQANTNVFEEDLITRRKRGDNHDL